MQNKVGSRGSYNIDFQASSIISGVDYNKPLHSFQNIGVVIVRTDLTKFSYEYLAYKFNIDSFSDLVLEWSKDQKRWNTKVYRETIERDYNATLRILKNLESNFLQSESPKVIY